MIEIVSGAFTLAFFSRFASKLLLFLCGSFPNKNQRESKNFINELNFYVRFATMTNPRSCEFGVRFFFPYRRKKIIMTEILNIPRLNVLGKQRAV